jgi:hypothetical protein
MSSWAEFMTMNLANPLMLLGDLDGALEIAAKVAHHAEVAGNDWMLLRSRSLEAQVLVLRGQAERMSSMLGWLEERAAEVGHPQQRHTSLAALALLRTALGEFEAAARLLRMIADAHRPHPLGPLVRAAITVGDIEAAQALVDMAPGDDGLLARAFIAEAREELDTALYRYLKAADLATGREEAVDNAFALLGQGRVLQALGRRAEATAPLEQAREVFARMKAAPAVAEIDTLLETLAARA